MLAVTLALPAAPAAAAWWHARARPTLEAVPRVATPRPAPAPVIDESPAIVTLQEQRASRWPAWVLAAWAALCLYRLFQIGRSYVYLRGVKRRAILSQAALPPIVRPARLLLSEEISSPMAVGFLHPAVILPESLPGELAQPEMEHVLLHEAAHIARKDDWTNLLARLLGAALALHPVAWWILRQIEREREIACDDWVVARTGSARPYAQSLARMSELRWSKRGAAHGSNQGEALASGIFGGGSRLGERIERLLERGREFSPRASMGRVAASVAALLGCVMAGSLAPKLIAFAQVKLSFEVASVKPVKPGTRAEPSVEPSASGLTVRSVNLLGLLMWAYQIAAANQISGPDWMLTQDFDIAARTSEPVSTDQLRQMLQTLLEQRFKLTLHREQKIVPLYSLLVDKSGPKVREVQQEPQKGGRLEWAEGVFTYKMVSHISQLAETLPIFLDGRTVQDKTGLTGVYEINLSVELEADQMKRMPQAGAAFTGFGYTSGIFDAVNKLGLKLEASKGPVDFLVVDHVEKPDAN